MTGDSCRTTDGSSGIWGTVAGTSWGAVGTIGGVALCSPWFTRTRNAFVVMACVEGKYGRDSGSGVAGGVMGDVIGPYG